MNHTAASHQVVLLCEGPGDNVCYGYGENHKLYSSEENV